MDSTYREVLEKTQQLQPFVVRKTIRRVGGGKIR